MARTIHEDTHIKDLVVELRKQSVPRKPQKRPLTIVI